MKINFHRNNYTQMPSFLFTLSVLAMLSFNCSNQSFRGKSETNKQQDGQIIDPNATDPGAEHGGTSPTVLGQGGPIDPTNPTTPLNPANLVPNYTACTAQQNLKQAYPSLCAANSVMVVINDGSEPELSCCPLADPGILSANPADLNVQRNDRCNPDELGVGMVSLSVAYCSKINTNVIRLGNEEPALYVKKKSNMINAELTAIARAYNRGDTCACPTNKILVGHHVGGNDQCLDICVEILPLAPPPP